LSGSPVAKSTQLKLEGFGPELVADRWSAEGPRSGSIVYLHGGGQTRHSWARTCRKLASTGWAGLAYDARGHGDSEWAADGDYGIDALVGDLHRAISAVTGPPVLVGASMGGMAALIAQGEDAATSRALVLVDVVPSFESQGSAEVFEFLKSGIDGFADPRDAADAINAYDPTRGPMIGNRMESVLRRRGDRWYWHWDPKLVGDPSGVTARADTSARRTTGTPINGDLNRLQARARAAAAKITVPVLLVRGAQSRVTSADGAYDLQQLIPHARRSDVAGAGHVITGTDNDRLCAELEEFLQSLDPVL
jgi:pimeloyl-ACP methyl ester carboxylesterase